MRIPGPDALARVIAGPMPFAKREMPLHDSTPDPGLFGPGSVTWRVMREPLLILGAGRALLMQAANPLVAQGAIDHSTYASDPYGRFDRTVLWVTLVSFGTTAEARAASRTVNRLHRRVSGALPPEHATPRVPTQRAYTAADLELLRWVHASFVDTMLVVHDALIGDLTEAERNRFVREWDAVAALMGVPRSLTWRTAAGLRAYVRREVRSGAALPGEGSRTVARTVLHPPVPSPLLRPGMDLLAFIATGLLPEDVRRAYGVRWTRAHALAHAATVRWVRLAKHSLPRRARISPVFDLALARSEGRWPGDGIDRIPRQHEISPKVKRREERIAILRPPQGAHAG